MLRTSSCAKRELLPFRFEFGVHEMFNNFPLGQVMFLGESLKTGGGLFGKLNRNGHGTWF